MTFHRSTLYSIVWDRVATAFGEGRNIGVVRDVVSLDDVVVGRDQNGSRSNPKVVIGDLVMVRRTKGGETDVQMVPDDVPGQAITSGIQPGVVIRHDQPAGPHGASQ